jgi:uncharacterized protein (TIGR03546 family)
MIYLKILGKFIKVLRSGASPGQIASGFALGTILGFTPVNSLHNLLIVILIIILNVNITAAVLAFVLFTILAFILDPVFHTIGYTILVNISFLEPVWTWLYNVPVAPLTRFNNTIVIGSLIFALVLYIPNYLLFKWFVTRYRDSWNQKMDKWKIVKIFKGSKLIQLYIKIKNTGG